MKILVIGATGMLGSAVFKVLNEHDSWSVFGTVRSANARKFFNSDIAENLIYGVEVEKHDSLIKAFTLVRPDVVINCVGLIKQLDNAENPLEVIPINTLLPHRLAQVCELVGARLIHMSTDCVFSGESGNYLETNMPDAKDLYGRSKFLGEVSYEHTITLRTSIIGHELQSTHGLVEWFLSQKTSCKGYTEAIFSGLPTVVLAHIIKDVVIPRTDLYGVYHVASHPISKYDLLKLIASVYGKKIEIIPDDKLVINRSLNAALFHEATGYVAPGWPELVKTMFSYNYQS